MFRINKNSKNAKGERERRGGGAVKEREGERERGKEREGREYRDKERWG